MQWAWPAAPRFVRATALLLAVIAAAGCVLVGLLALLGGARSTTFNVTATTERVEFTTGSAPDSRWHFENIEWREPFGDSARSFSGGLQLAAGVAVFIERIGTGPLWIHLESETTDGSVGAV